MLARAGNEVIFIARGATLEALRKNGLRVESSLGDFTLPEVHATSDAATVGIMDAVFVTTKAWQVMEAAQQIRSMVGQDTVVVPLQNGVEAYDQLAAVVGAGHVLDGMCHILAMVTAPAVIRHSGPKALITIGERNNVSTPRLKKLVECLNAAGLRTRVPDNIQAALWEKFEFIASFGGVGAVTRAPVGVMQSKIAARACDAGNCGSGRRMRCPGAERIGGRNDEIRRVVAARRHSLDAARPNGGSTFGD
jgi:2-dehydropantoate 2-reductase